MSIDQTTVAKIAHLARLTIPDAEQQQLAAELNKIIEWVAQLDAVDVKDVEPLANVNDAYLNGRADIVTDGNKRDDVLANAPAQTAGFFTVPKVIE